jgi:FAD binding domain of DNA photolyase
MERGNSRFKNRFKSADRLEHACTDAVSHTQSYSTYNTCDVGCLLLMLLHSTVLVTPHNTAYTPSYVQGRTGYPFIDANMRELALTGFMSNRGRQVCVNNSVYIHSAYTHTKFNQSTLLFLNTCVAQW